MLKVLKSESVASTLRVALVRDGDEYSIRVGCETIDKYRVLETYDTPDDAFGDFTRHLANEVIEYNKLFQFLLKRIATGESMDPVIEALKDIESDQKKLEE